MNRASAKIVVDMIIGAAFVISLTSMRQESLHVGAGIVLVIGSAIHIALHWRWVAKHTKNALGSCVIRGSPPSHRETSSTTRVNYLLDMAILAMFMICAGTGLAFAFTDSTPFLSAHKFSGGVFAIGVLVHMTVKWRSLMSITEKVLRRTVGFFNHARTRSAEADQ